MQNYTKGNKSLFVLQGPYVSWSQSSLALAHQSSCRQIRLTIFKTLDSLVNNVCVSQLCPSARCQCWKSMAECTLRAWQSPVTSASTSKSMVINDNIEEEFEIDQNVYYLNSIRDGKYIRYINSYFKKVIRELVRGNRKRYFLKFLVLSFLHSIIPLAISSGCSDYPFHSGQIAFLLSEKLGI